MLKCIRPPSWARRCSTNATSNGTPPLRKTSLQPHVNTDIDAQIVQGNRKIGRLRSCLPSFVHRRSKHARPNTTSSPPSLGSPTSPPLGDINTPGDLLVSPENCLPSEALGRILSAPAISSSEVMSTLQTSSSTPRLYESTNLNTIMRKDGPAQDGVFPTYEQPSSTKHKRHTEDFTRTIEVLFIVDNVEIMRRGKALFDTGNPLNVISPAFAQLFGLNFGGETAEVKLRLPGNNEFSSVAAVSGRFSPVEDEVEETHQGLWYDKKFMPATFHVSPENEPFDIVIGSGTIVEEDLMRFNHKFGFPGFRAYHKDAPSLRDPVVQDTLAWYQAEMASNATEREAHERTMEERRRSQQATAVAAAARVRAQIAAAAVAQAQVAVDAAMRAQDNAEAVVRAQPSGEAAAWAHAAAEATARTRAVAEATRRAWVAAEEAAVRAQAAADATRHN